MSLIQRLRDWWRGHEDPGAHKVAVALLLTDAVPPPEEVVAAWTPRERYDAWRWAWHEHLNASDNEDVPRLPEPPHVKALPRFDWRAER